MEEKNGTLHIFSNRRLRLRKDGTGAFRTGSGEAGLYEFKGAERDIAEGRIGAGRVGFLIVIKRTVYSFETNRKSI